LESSNHVVKTAACSAFILALAATNSTQTTAQTNASSNMKKPQIVNKTK